MKNVHELTDKELEECVDGSTNLTMLKDILTRHGVVGNDGYLDPEIFANWFAQGIEAYIEAEADSDEWNEANDVNWTWGYDIADNINIYISDNFKDDNETINQ